LEFQTALCLEETDAVSLNLRLKEQFSGMAESWTGERAAPIPQVPDDMTLDGLIKLPEFADSLRSARYIPFAYDLKKAQLEFVDLSKIFCYSVSGAARSGKTNMIKVFMRLVKEQNGKVYVFDGLSREIEGYARSVMADGYYSTPDALFDFMQDVIIPEFTRRNAAKAEFIKNGKKNIDEYVASLPKVFLFINDMTALCEAVYGSEKDMKGFMEQMVTKGDGHLIYLFACVSQGDMTGEYNTKRLMRAFAGWKEGLHLGGKLDDQKLFDFEAPVLERGKKLPPGYGHAVINGVTKRIITPAVEPPVE
jgi:S-DNA-T family DNA segregation ATPase FtsK/SpoIIIE